MHKHNVAHTNIKPANIFVLIDDTGKITFKLADFGACKYFGQYGESENTEHQEDGRLKILKPSNYAKISSKEWGYGKDWCEYKKTIEDVCQTISDNLETRISRCQQFD